MKIKVWVSGLLVSAGAVAFESAPQMIFVDSSYSGHEEITRQALNTTAKRIQETDPGNNLFDLSELSFDLKAEPKGLMGYQSKNLVISGNFASDFPRQATTVNLIEFWKNPGFADFENPKNQVVHFLRNYTTPLSLASSKKTCLEARRNIKYVTEEAIKRYRSGKKSEGLFLIGHAMHTIQDSFSPAHAVRASDENNNDIQRVCFFGNAMAKKFSSFSKDSNGPLCYHRAPDSRDAIWNSNPSLYKEALKNWGKESISQCDKNSNYPRTEEEKSACLSHEARLAKIASEKYLLLVFGEISPSNLTPQGIEKFIQMLDTHLFDGPVGHPELDQKMPKGIMRCDGLSDEEIYGSEPMVG
jgi:hypothetical protein